MLINDRILGKVELSEPVLLDLINSESLQRLKGINSGGPCQYIHTGLADETRYAHSVGVMLLLRHFNASLKEQIAGLLHDVSHTAFSHLADYVFGGDKYTMDFQDRILAEFILKSGIPAILKTHNLDVQDVLDIHNFSLLEQEIPDLCADRMEYSLGHAFMHSHLMPLSSREVLSYIAIQEGRFIMTSPTVAWKYARAFLYWYTQELAGPRCLAVHELLADAIKRGLAISMLSREDMFRDDVYVLGKLRDSTDPHIMQLIALLTPQFDCVIDTVAPDLRSGIKFRYIDPLVRIKDGTLVRVSALYPDFAQELTEHKKIFDHQEFSIRITSNIVKEYGGVSGTLHPLHSTRR